MTTAPLSKLESAVLEAVRSELAAYDASHDIAHIMRVFSNAAAIATGESVTDVEELLVIRLAALLHDVGDSKYSGSEEATAHMVRKILEEQGVSKATTERILEVVDRVSFRKEIAAAAAASGAPAPVDEVVERALKVVQDADRLDAIGAVGIARCFSYGGAKGRHFYSDDDLSPEFREGLLAKKELTVDEYQRYSASSVGHFYAKLLRLRDMMKTGTARAIADGRTHYMREFLEQLFGEVAGAR
jgi:uncharacterized protein